VPKLRRLSGNEVLSIFAKFGFSVLSQKGSHVKIRRLTASGSKESLTIPIHDELDTGTLKAILRQAGRFVSEAELTKYFYR